jgi:predicted O-methyltransferase YrrM
MSAETRRYDLMRDPERLGPAILKGLEAMVAWLDVRPGWRMYEIGSYAGESAEVFARSFSEVHCVDPWSDLTMFGVHDAAWVEKDFDQRTRPLKNVTKHKCTSREAAKEVPDLSLDFVYVDAMHDMISVMRDLSLWWPKVRPGRCIGGHDHMPNYFAWTDVAEAVDQFFHGRLPQVFPDSSWVMVKPEEA